MNRNFKLLWIANSVSTFGSAIYTMALALLSLTVSHSVLGAGMVLFASTSPYFVLGFFGGVIADRVNRKKLMLLCDLSRACLTLSIPLAQMVHALTIEHLVLVGFLMNCFRLFFLPANQASVPMLVGDRSELNKANGYMGAVNNLATMMGPTLGGILLLFGPSVAQLLFIDSASYLISALCISMITYPQVEKERSVQRPSLLHDAAAGIKYLVVGNKGIAILLGLFMAQLLLGTGLAQLAYPKLLEAQHYYGENAYGFLLSLVALSTAVSSFLFTRVRVDKSEKWIFIGYSLRGVAYLLFAFVPGVVGIGLAAIVMGSSYTFSGTTLTTILQLRSPNHMLGKVMAVRSSIGNIADSFAYLIVGKLLMSLSLQLTFAISAVYVFVVVLIGFACWKWFRGTEKEKQSAFVTF